MDTSAIQEPELRSSSLSSGDSRPNKKKVKRDLKVQVSDSSDVERSNSKFVSSDAQNMMMNTADTKNYLHLKLTC